jgi:hypothetical protein
MASLRAEVEATYACKEQLITLNDKAELNTNEMKARLVLIASPARTDQVELSQRSPKLEMEVELQEAACR